MGRIRYGARTEDELRNREVEASKLGAWATVLTAHYLTDPDVVAAVLPPPLEPADEPRVRVTIGRVDVPGHPPFGAGAFAVRCRHEGTTGDYPLVMPMTAERAVIGGRETFGEPKKLGEVTLERDDDRVVGRFARLGTTFVTVAGRVVETLPNPPDGKRINFAFKFLPAPDGKGFDDEPALTYCHREEQTRSIERVEGTITLAESRFDPVVDLPVRGGADITFAERHSVEWAEIHTRVAGELLRPYVHQRYDDLSPVGEE